MLPQNSKEVENATSTSEAAACPSQKKRVRFSKLDNY